MLVYLSCTEAAEETSTRRVQLNASGRNYKYLIVPQVGIRISSACKVNVPHTG